MTEEIEFLKENGVHHLVKWGDLYAYVKILHDKMGYTALSPEYRGTHTDRQGQRQCFGGLLGCGDHAIKSVAYWTTQGIAKRRYNSCYREDE